MATAACGGGSLVAPAGDLGAEMIFNLALLVIGVVGLLLVLVVIDAVFGDWFQSFGFWED